MEFSFQIIFFFQGKKSGFFLFNFFSISFVKLCEMKILDKVNLGILMVRVSFEMLNRMWNEGLCVKVKFDSKLSNFSF